MFNSTGSKPALRDVPAWSYKTPGMTTTTSSVTNPNGIENSWIKAGLLGKASNKAVRGVLEERAKEGAQKALDFADKHGGTGYAGAAGQGGTGLASTNGEWALGATPSRMGAESAYMATSPTVEDLKLSYMNGEAAPAGEAVMNMGGLADDSVEAATSAADSAGQTIADIGAQTYGDMVADMGTNMATEAATEGATQAANVVPIAGTALNIGANLAQGNYGAAAGAGAGAAMGSVIPGVGTALGGTIGGLLGSFF